ncbi:hypothetical protein PIB30_106681 [Stylosanthes scabra]|uniref:Uncharacterized protein n=1 Tax=Stylosanthes scabra TaxID=79078 RepID=A0ABU6YZ52_9FABA|nr:hypothetical protein [Stylosanthes scabra]
MGSGLIYYEYEKREKFEDHDMRADAELGTFKIASASKIEESLPRDDVHLDVLRRITLREHCQLPNVKTPLLLSKEHVPSVVPRSWELIPPSEGWMCDADDEKEIEGMDPSEKGESSEEDPEMEEEYPEEAGNPQDRVPATPSLPMDIDAEEDFQHYVEELGRAPEPSPLRSSQASVPDVPEEAADRQSASRDGPSYDVSGVWPPRSLSPSF